MAALPRPAGCRRPWLLPSTRGRRLAFTFSPARPSFGSLDEGDAPAGGGGGAPDQHPPLTVDQLKALTELHVGNVYEAGVVGGAEELAARLGTSLTQGLASDEVRAARRAA